VGPTELSDGIVSELSEDPVVESPGFLQADNRVGLAEVVGDGPDAQIGLGDELVEEETPDGLGRSAVSGEERPLHDLGEIDDPEHRAVDIGEEPTEQSSFFVGERLSVIAGGHGTWRGVRWE
jgi:hypothetical protein